MWDVTLNENASSHIQYFLQNECANMNMIKVFLQNSIHSFMIHSKIVSILMYTHFVFLYKHIKFLINGFIFVIIEAKHIYYSLSMTHKITSVLLRIIRLKTLNPDLLNWLYYPKQILPFSQVNYLSQC